MSVLKEERTRVVVETGGADASVLALLLERGYSVSCGTTAPARHGEVVVELEAPGRPEGALETVESARHRRGGGVAGSWKPWFPVIDYSRCTNCMQCLSFCLFDVYGVDDAGKITVRNQDNCKTDCPACSRVCPDVAILFPKYRNGPINGAEVDDEDIRREAMKVDISALLGGDVYALLKDRSTRAKSRFSRERDDERALKERKRCLDKIQEGLGIPDEVLSSLPSLEEIQAKAAEARRRAREDLPRQASGADHDIRESRIEGRQSPEGGP